MALARYNVDGSLDSAFDGDGKLTTAIGSESAANSVAIQANGKIVAGDYFNNGSNRDFALVRYNPDGTPDATFDGDGIVTTPIGTGDDEARALAIGPDAKIVAAGASWSGSNWDFAVARYIGDPVVSYDWSGFFAPVDNPWDRCQPGLQRDEGGRCRPGEVQPRRRSRPRRDHERHTRSGSV